jgi:hypothetical protein
MERGPAARLAKVPGALDARLPTPVALAFRAIFTSMRTWVAGLSLASQTLACGESTPRGDAGGAGAGMAGLSSGGTAGSLATGGGGASGGSFATGGGGASGGSFATGGGGGSGGTMTAAGSAGASAGSGGATGGKSNYGNPLPVDPRCNAFAARVAEACPSEWTFAASHAFCQEGFNELYPMGCQSEFAALIECEGEIDCDAGFSPSCPVTYAECSNAFVLSTECIRAGGGVTCPDGTYAFICRSEPPAPCTTTEGLGSASDACCPPFPDAR